jgi:hypothetical protein
MVMLNDAFPGNWLKTQDLQGREVNVIIASADIETVGKERKLCLFFRGKQKGMICNKTNAGRIALAYGEDTAAWIGQPITLYSEMVDFQGKATWGLRVRVVQQQRAVDPQFVAARQQVAQHLAGNGNGQYTPPTTTMPVPTSTPDSRAHALDDEIPF